MKLPWKQTLLKRWMAIERRWKRKAPSRRSPDTAAMRLPRSLKKPRALAFIGPRVSHETGMKRCEFVNPMYFASFLSAAMSAAPPAVVEVVGRCETASVSAMVTSHIRLLLPCQGISVRPSGRLPSDLDRPDGSLVDGMPARVRPRQIRSLR